ncbi:MAG: DUF433 domain-containing protein [Pirellulales bacterium]
METSVEKQHIVVTPGTCGGKARVAGHRIRVLDVVLWTEEGRSPEEIVGDFPQLSLADVFAALAYYHDHREQIDAEILADDECVRSFQAGQRDAGTA